mmetsp:Transcript_128689/g.349309  ORF Transcript_128689/g.349309 Transcript_128689/m.349309 type:complete len:217 (-) Transcript_128689:245-895(-)
MRETVRELPARAATTQTGSAKAAETTGNCLPLSQDACGHALAAKSRPRPSGRGTRHFLETRSYHAPPRFFTSVIVMRPFAASALTLHSWGSISLLSLSSRNRRRGTVATSTETALLSKLALTRPASDGRASQGTYTFTLAPSSDQEYSFRARASGSRSFCGDAAPSGEASSAAAACGLGAVPWSAAGEPSGPSSFCGGPPATRPGPVMIFAWAGIS